MLANIGRLVQLDVNKSILRDLDPSSNSPTLATLLDDFNGLFIREKIQLYSFQEGTGKSGLGGLGSKVHHQT